MRFLKYGQFIIRIYNKRKCFNVYFINIKYEEINKYIWEVINIMYSQDLLRKDYEEMEMLRIWSRYMVIEIGY